LRERAGQLGGAWGGEEAWRSVAALQEQQHADANQTHGAETTDEEIQSHFSSKATQAQLLWPTI
jgi:hypothetical protein